MTQIYDAYDDSDQHQHQYDVDAEFMGFPILLYNPLQLFVRSQQVFIHFVHLLG